MTLKKQKIICIYCKTNSFEVGEGSKEHVILSSLGGKKSSRNICCTDCNTKYGNEIDIKLSETYQVFSTMLGIKTGRNKKAPTLKSTGEIDGRSFDTLSGGIIKYSSPKVNVRNINSKVYDICITARSQQELLHLLSNIYKSKGVDHTKLKKIEAESVFTKAPKVTGRISFGDDKQYRSVAKMLLTYISTMISPERLRSGIFSELIDYIMGNSDIYPVWLETVDMKDYPKISEVNHRMFIFCSKTKRIAYGCLEIFGHIRYSVILSTGWDSEDINKCHVIDPITHKRGDYDIQPITDFPLGLKDRRSLENKSDYLVTQFKRLINLFEERQRVIVEQSILDELMDKYNICKEEDINTDIFAEFVQEYIGRINCIYHGENYQEDVIINSPFQ